jgi:hypothetical protein
MALVNSNIAMSYRGVEVPQQNALADYAAVQQIQSGQRQAEVSQMQIEQMRRDDATLKQIQAKSMENGGPADLDSIADAYLKSGNAKFVEFGIGLRQKLDEKKQFASIMGGAPRAAAPASEAYPGYNESIGMAAPAAAAAAPASEPYPGYNQAIGMTPSVNAMAPAAAPGTNALADVAMLRQRRDALLSMGTPQAIAAARALDSDIVLASKPPVRQVVSAGSTVLGPDNKVIFTAPAAQTTLARLQTELAALPKGDPRIPAYEAMIKKETSHTPGVSVNVSTEKKYGEAFGGKLADVDIGKLTAAEKAPQLADSANRIIGLVSQGNVFTGPAADIKLNIARALNVAGASNEDKIANTEQLIQGTGQSTLDAIKSAGLGTGQGFTDKDLKFLQGIAGGTINLTAQTLTTLAELQHRAATRSAESWNKRVKEVPSEVLKGTGLSTTPINVPPLSTVKSGGGRPEGVGPNWTFENDAAGNKAWVSPDRKSFKEVK